MKRLDNGNFELTEDELKDLLIRDHKLRALELSKLSGVDTWDEYRNAEDHYLKQEKEKYGDNYCMKDYVDDMIKGGILDG